MDRSWSPPAPLSRLDPLDGLRGLAVAAVLLFHGGYLRGGYLGVDLFFTLSGFLITRLILDALAHDTFSFRGFWARRARRLLPAAWLLLLAVLVAGPVLVRTSELSSLRGDAVATFGYVANWWRMTTSSSYFALYETPSPLQHTWSLAIEEQFYLAWPIVLVVLWRLGRGRDGRTGLIVRVTLCLALASVTAGALLYRAGDGGMRSYYGTDTRAASLLIGAIASIVVWRHGAKLARAQWHRRLAPVALAAIGVAWLVGANGAWLYRGGLAALAVATSIVLVTITTAREGVLQRVLGVRPLVALGVISYGVYLFHWPIYEWLSPERTGMSGLSLLVVRVATTLAAATVSYVAVEHPYRSRRGPIAWRAVGAVSAVTALLVLAVQLPIPARLDPQRAALVVRSVPTVPTASTIPNASAATAAPTVPIPTPTHLLVVGDSVALRLATGFSDQSAAGVDVQDLGTTFCGMGDQWPEMHIRENLITDRCADWRTAWPAAADDMGANGTLAVFGIETSVRLIDGQWREACDPVYDNWLQSTVRDLIGALGTRGPVWVALAPYNRAPTSVDESTLAQRDEHTDCTNHDYAVAVALGGPHGHLIDLSSFVCPDASTCTDIVGGITLRPDGLHYEGPGADVVARWLLDQVGDP